MTIDPSAIPNFGAPEPPPGPPPIVKPDNGLVANLMEQIGLKYGTDAEGDLVASWSGFRVYMMFRGETKELFAVRAFYERAYPLDQKAELVDVLDEWNRDTLWPKVYTHTNEEGVVRLIGESQMVIPGGVNIDYFIATTVNWIQAAVGFHGWLLDRLGLEADVDSVENVESALLNEMPPIEGDAEAAEGADGAETDEKPSGKADDADDADKADKAEAAEAAEDKASDEDKPKD
jgi:hypothetical protein